MIPVDGGEHQPVVLIELETQEAQTLPVHNRSGIALGIIDRNIERGI